MIELKIEMIAKLYHKTMPTIRLETNGDVCQEEAQEIIDKCRCIMATLEQMLESVKNFDKTKEEQNV